MEKARLKEGKKEERKEVGSTIERKADTKVRMKERRKKEERV